MIQNNTGNQYYRTTIVAPITSTVRLPLSPVHVLLAANRTTGLVVPSVAAFNQIRTVDRSRLIRKLGAVDDQIMIEVDQAIRISLGMTH